MLNTRLMLLFHTSLSPYPLPAPTYSKPDPVFERSPTKAFANHPFRPKIIKVRMSHIFVRRFAQAQQTF